MIPLSATRLSTYQRCAHAYYLRYHAKVQSAAFAPPQLGQILHEILAEIYRRPAWSGPPDLAAIELIWLEAVARCPGLSPSQQQEGWQILRQYFDRFIAPLDQWQEPIGVEGRLEGSLWAGQLQFKIRGRYDRLESLPSQDLQAQVHLIDYKTSRSQQTPDQLAMDLQLGLYQMAIDQVYGAALRRVSHIYLRSGEIVSFEAHPDQKAQVLDRVTDLALHLVSDRDFSAQPGDHCRHCSFRRYCAAVTDHPDPVPATSVSLQLSLLGHGLSIAPS